MVKLTVDIIIKSRSGYTKRKRDETVDQFLNRMTHLHLDDKNIDEIEDELSLCNNLSVLYLYDNSIKTIPDLKFNRQLTHLYLQNNQIRRIEHLQSLNHLVKLYLGHNSITVLEGLEKLTDLIELHIEHQRLPPGEKLIFDSSSLSALSNSLQFLDITGNNCDSIKELDCLTRLSNLVARDNNVQDLKDLRMMLQKLNRLEQLDLSGNPVCSANKYRDRVILVSINLDTLDGKEITKMAREFVLNLYATREAIRKKNAENLSRKSTLLDFTHLPRDVPPMEGSPMAHGGYLMPGLKSHHFDKILARAAGDTLSNRLVHSSKSYLSSRLPVRKSLISINLEIPPNGYRPHSRYQPSM